MCSRVCLVWEARLGWSLLPLFVVFSFAYLLVLKGEGQGKHIPCAFGLHWLHPSWLIFALTRVCWFRQMKIAARALPFFQKEKTRVFVGANWLAKIWARSAVAVLFHIKISTSHQTVFFFTTNQHRLTEKGMWPKRFRSPSSALGVFNYLVLWGFLRLESSSSSALQIQVPSALSLSAPASSPQRAVSGPPLISSSSSL